MIRRRLTWFVAGMLVAGGIFGVPMAAAAFSTNPSATASYASSMIAPPTNVTFTCTGTHSAQVTWTASVSGYATGYTLLDNVNGGGQQVVQTGINATSISISVVHKSTYTVAVEASYLAWTSQASSWTASASC